MEIFRTDIKDKKEFTYENDTLKRLDYCETTGLYLYGRYDGEDGHLKGYELIKPVKCINPDGSTVGKYPSNEQFGTYGWYYPARTDLASLKRALTILNKNEREEAVVIPPCKWLKNGKINPEWAKLISM